MSVLSSLQTRLAALAAAVLLAASGAMAAGPASELGPEVGTATLEGAYVGQLDLQPFRGAAGTAVTVTGSGFTPGESLDLVWNTVRGSWLIDGIEYHGRDYAPVAYRIAGVTPDADGSFSATFEAPEDFGFWHDVTLQEGGRLLNQAAFRVEMQVSISPESGPAGSPVTVDVSGIGWRQMENSWTLLYDNAFTGWMSSVTTGGHARFVIPATGQPGTHVLEVIHGDFTFPYRNMQQSPEPDRPTFTATFEVTADAPVLPPAPEAQSQAVVARLPAPGDITVEPAFGQVGQPFTASADGFAPGATATLYWSTVTGNRVSGSGWETSEREIAQAVADAQGRVSFTLATPDDLGGAHDLRIAGADVGRTGSYWIAPSALPLDVTSGPAGTPFEIHLKGVGWSETANICTIVYDNGYIGYACGFNSQGDVVIPMHATGAPGVHFIDLYPAIYKGTETRPLNFRLPQLTYAEDHPGEDLPAFRFAFEVTGPDRE
ncbi:MAG: hypothetical protein H3C51_04115 [Rubellimicrobium sp.]|nr:hypothetical protein [Rubellimicrobium sp.]